MSSPSSHLNKETEYFCVQDDVIQMWKTGTAENMIVISKYFVGGRIEGKFTKAKPASRVRVGANFA